MQNQLEKDLRQRSRINWIQAGDSNTRFFHSSIWARQASNSIWQIKNPDNSISEDMTYIKGVVEFFTKLFLGSQTASLPRLAVPFKRVFSPKGAAWLDHSFSLEEIENVVRKGDPEKSPGPDGFTFAFYQKAWDIIKDDCMQIFKLFEKGETMLREINHTFITLVLKKKNSIELHDFRAISCCNVLYKIISKVLTNCLQHVIGGLVSLNQSVFIPGRQISDGILLAHELLRGFKRKNGSRRVHQSRPGF